MPFRDDCARDLARTRKGAFVFDAARLAGLESDGRVDGPLRALSMTLAD
jgi:hypothetical protein